MKQVKECHRERSTYYLNISFGLGENVDFMCTKPARVAVPVPCLCSLQSTPHWLVGGLGQWELPLQVGGSQQGNSKLPLSLSFAWAAWLATAMAPLWFQKVPAMSSMISVSSWWCWSRAAGIPGSFQPSPGKAEASTDAYPGVVSPPPTWHLGSSVTQAKNSLCKISV